MAPMGAAHPMGPEYQNGLFSMGESCCATCWCSCCVVGATEAMVETGVVKQPCDGVGPGCALFVLASFLGMNSCYSTFVTRKKLREKYGMNDGTVPDCLSHFLCPCCAICQDYNEAKQRCQTAAPQVVMMQTIPVQQQMQVVGQV